MNGKGDRGTVFGGAGTVIAVVVVLGIGGSITSATALGCSAAAVDCRPTDAVAAVDSVVETTTLGATGIVGVPPGDRGGPNGSGNGAPAEKGHSNGNGGEASVGEGDSDGDKNGAEASPNRGGEGGSSAGADSSEDGGTEANDGSDASAGNDGSKGASDGAATKGGGADAPGASGDGDAPGKSDDAPGQSLENRTADERRGPPETVPAAVNVSARGQNGRSGTVVNASVGDVRANERARVELDVPGRGPNRTNASGATVGGPNATLPTNASDVAVTAMELTPTRNGSFTMNVTTADRIDGSPAFESDDGTEAMTHIRVNHSISNDELNGTVDIDFRVSKERLENESVDPEDVSLYRYENGSWTELATAVVNETGDAVSFRAESPGLSEFAAGAKRARFSLETVEVAVEEIVVGDDLKVHVGIANDGGADGEFAAQLLLDGDVVEERSLTIAAGGERQTLFDHRVNDSGEYEVRVNDAVAGSVVVQQSVDEESTTTAGETDATATEAAESAKATTAEPSTTVSGTEVPEPIFHPTALVFVVVAALVARVRGRR
ncbi:PGF-pre-PGF domain-containing protein [Halogeometricum rufum]|nr:PGF-pre-PGF domain-containing protein [Halogeometricum rufum]